MPPINRVQRIWDHTAPSERRALLEAFARRISDFAAMCEGSSTDVLVGRNYGELPTKVSGALALSVVNERFSAEEYERIEKLFAAVS